MGNPPRADLNLYDRMLLRKYTLPATASMFTDSPSLASVPHYSPPVESAKKRRRFFKKGKPAAETSKREVWSSSRRALPADFSPRLQSQLFELSRLSLILLRVLCLHTSRYCIIRWSEMELYRSGYLQEFTSLEAPARRSANRLQASAVAVTDSAASMSLAALRRESEQQSSVEVSISDQLAIAADVRPKKFRTKWQRIVYDGPTARKDAESAERDRWIQLLANLLRSTDTPMGKVDQGKSEQCSVARRRSPCGNSQVKGTVSAKVFGLG